MENIYREKSLGDIENFILKSSSNYSLELLEQETMYYLFDTKIEAQKVLYFLHSKDFIILGMSVYKKEKSSFDLFYAWFSFNGNDINTAIDQSYEESLEYLKYINNLDYEGDLFVDVGYITLDDYHNLLLRP